MTTTRPFANTGTAAHEYQSRARVCREPGDLSTGAVVLESCHSTWIFDCDRKQFRRILRGIEVGKQCVSTQWRAYWELQLDPVGEGFTVYLNASRTRLIRSWRHNEDCSECRNHQTDALSLDEIGHAVAV